jgi:UDP-N-acetylglucosamine--N-acetylmuramyl-(pentapeptide) pyrophosphoryl-undecaprenol N-acetylglucosamine transferase
MRDRCFYFAGGGTGGHIYPAIAVAEQIAGIEPEAKIHFFCSTREIDKRILGQTHFNYTALPAKGFSIRPRGLIEFITSFRESNRIARDVIRGDKEAVVIGAGGFVSASVCWVAHRLNVPIVLLNVDIVPGRANKVLARWADEVFVQFEEAGQYFARRGTKADVVGCPLRNGFKHPDPDAAREQLGLDKQKKILLITGASSGAQNINKTICLLLEKLSTFADDWQIVHLTGLANHEHVLSGYHDTQIKHTVLAYFDDMPSLLATADLVIGRSGAVSVAEYAAAGAPSICMPYPYHKDRHQYLNAGKLVEAGAGVIVDDVPDEKDRTEWLWEELEELMKDDEKRRRMAKACRIVARPEANIKIAERLLEMANEKVTKVPKMS